MPGLARLARRLEYTAYQQDNPCSTTGLGAIANHRSELRTGLRDNTVSTPITAAASDGQSDDGASP
jgi:hypothetical protein